MIQTTGKEFTSIYGTIFYTVLSDDLCHNGFRYKLGLNTDINKFNPSGSCTQGGLYFTNIQNLLKFMSYGSKIGIVTVPDDAKVYVENDKFKADKIILTKLIESEHEALAIYKLSRENGCPWDKYTCASAALNGHLEILK